MCSATRGRRRFHGARLVFNRPSTSLVAAQVNITTRFPSCRRIRRNPHQRVGRAASCGRGHCLHPPVRRDGQGLYDRAPHAQLPGRRQGRADGDSASDGWLDMGGLPAPRVAHQFLGRSLDLRPRQAFPDLPIPKRLLGQPILERMKRDHRAPSAWDKPGGNPLQGDSQ